MTRTVNDLVMGRAEKYVAPNAHAKQHESMTIGWSTIEFLPRRHRLNSRRPRLLGLSVPFMERQWIPKGVKVHRSVEQVEDRPPNLPDEVDFVD